jgi:two-component system, sensor histidine kinase YesM
LALRLPPISWNSIRFKLVLGLMVVLIPLIGLLIYNNHYGIQVVHNQVAISNKNLISLYMAQIDAHLQDADRKLIGLAVSDVKIRSMDSPSSEDEYQLAKHDISQRLTNDILLYKAVDSFFVYSMSKQDLLHVPKSGTSKQEDQQVEAYLYQLFHDHRDSSESLSSSWFPLQIGRDYYLIRAFHSGGVYIGAWVNAKTMLTPLHLIDLGNKGTALFVTDTGEPMVSTNPNTLEQVDFTKGFGQYYTSGTKNNLLIVGETSQEGGFSLAAVIPNEQILQNLPKITRIIQIISFVSILLLPVSLLLLRNILLVPLKRMIAVMRRINDGNINVRIESYPTSDTMMTQIEELKINVYEEQLAKQRSELQHLQLQINPHFFMNSLNILYNLAQVKNYQLIQEMTLCLVRYFRFMFRSNLTFVSLKEEMEHVRNYIRIQELRFPGRLTCTLDTPEFLGNTPVPPLIIQTFLENALKHSVTQDESLQLSVSIDLKETGLEPYIECVIRDTGRGFPEDVLREIRAGNRVIDEQGEHIGIWNVKRRLQLLYGDKASLSCYNGFPSGAVVEIKLPIHIET